MKNKNAVALGAKGGNARRESLSPERRSEIARMGGLARHKGVAPKLHPLKAPCPQPGCKVTVNHEHILPLSK
jgi:hypothetical protein